MNSDVGDARDYSTGAGKAAAPQGKEAVAGPKKGNRMGSPVRGLVVCEAMLQPIHKYFELVREKQ